VCGGAWGCGPEDWVVVGEEGEDYAEEEACCWRGLLAGFLLRFLFIEGVGWLVINWRFGAEWVGAKCCVSCTAEREERYVRQTIRKVAKGP
jgi:hypothetical protein